MLSMFSNKICTMKRFIPIFIYMAFFATSTLSAQQKTVEYVEDAGGAIKNLVIERANGEVTVTMDIDVSDISVGRDETIVLTPVVTDKVNKLTMPSIELMGRRAYFYYMRDGEVSQTENPFSLQRAAKRVEKKEGLKQSFPYTYTFPFEEWMRNSDVDLRTGWCGCGELRGEKQENMGNFGHEIYQPSYVWSFIEPDPEPIKVRDESHSAYINFYVDKYNIVEKYKNNEKELAGILESISKVDDDEDLTITSITIEGWASPEDTEQHNQTLSENRANSLANWVTKKTGIDRNNIQAIGRGEDWAGLRREVEASDVEGKKQILAIIDETNMSLDGKDWALKSLVPPTIYQNLLKNIYPRQRRNDYKIIYEVRNFNLEEARVLVDENPKKLSVGEIYKVAGSYERGSKEYNHAMEVAAKQYPEVVAAAINAANLRIAEGDYHEALKILGRSNQEDARIQAAEGYIYLLEKNYDKARELLSKAADQGNEDAKHNLAEMEKHLASI